MANGSGFFDHQPKIQFMNQKLPNLFFGLRFLVNDDGDNEYFDTYTVNAGQSAEDISLQVYETQKLWWVVMYYNGLINVYEDLPLTAPELEDYARLVANDEYGSPTTEEYYEVLDALSEINREKRHIRLPKKEYVDNALRDGINKLFE